MEEKYVDFYGRPITFEEWGVLVAHANPTILKTDAGDFTVETQWVGYEREAFATLAFPKDDDSVYYAHDYDPSMVIRHISLREAKRGHQIAVDACLALTEERRREERRHEERAEPQDEEAVASIREWIAARIAAEEAVEESAKQKQRETEAKQSDQEVNCERS